MWTIIVLLNVATFLSVAVFALVGCSGDKEAEPGPSKPAAAKSQKSANKKVQKPKEKEPKTTRK